jgi:hypothetical protein
VAGDIDLDDLSIVADVNVQAVLDALAAHGTGRGRSSICPKLSVRDVHGFRGRGGVRSAGAAGTSGCIPVI